MMKFLFNKRLIIIYLSMLFVPQICEAQTVSVIRNLSFGNIYFTGSGGSISVSNTGSVTTTGTVGLFASSPTPTTAIIRVYAGRNSRFTWGLSYSSTITLNRTKGGSVTVTLTDTDPSGWFVIPKDSSIDFSIGGKMTVRSISYNPGGYYSGTFTVTLNYF